MSEELRKATVAEAKAAWDGYQGKRSIRKVVAALKAKRLSITVSKLQRWKESGWKITEMTETANRAAKAISAKTGQHEERLTRLDVIAAEEAEMKAERERLMKDDMLDSELARLALRESLVAQIVLARQITRRAAVLAEIAPGIAAKLIEVLKAPAASTTIILSPNEQKDANGDGAKVVDGRMLPDKSASQLAIEAFKNRRAHEVAA